MGNGYVNINGHPTWVEDDEADLAPVLLLHGAFSGTDLLNTALQAVDLSRQTLELVRSQYEVGTATQLDLLTAQDSLVTADVAVAQARFDLALAALSLQRSAGVFPSKELR